jgi:hypothetical protein
MVLEMAICALLDSPKKLRQCKNISCFNSRRYFATLEPLQQGWSTFCGRYREARHARGIGRVHFRRCGFVGSVLRSSLLGPASPQPDLARTATFNSASSAPEGATSPVLGFWNARVQISVVPAHSASKTRVNALTEPGPIPSGRLRPSSTGLWQPIERARRMGPCFRRDDGAERRSITGDHGPCRRMHA